MKSIITLSTCITFLFITSNINAQSNDYLQSVSDTGSGVTTNNSKNWTDLTSITVDVTNISNLLITAAVNMRPDGSSTSSREANYNIYQSDNTTNISGIIKREIIKNSETGVESWGIGTQIHIFDVSALTGNKTFVLQHRNYGSTGSGRNIFSQARLTGVALTTQLNGYELSNVSKRYDSYEQSSSPIYSGVTNMVTDTISLPIKGDIYVAASLNSKASVTYTTAEYKLQYSIDNGLNYINIGKSVKRTMYGSSDDGMISLVALLQNQDPNVPYLFRIAHRRVSGNGVVSTGNANLVAIALAHSNGSFFPSIYQELNTTGTSISGISTSAQSVTSSIFNAASSINGVNSSLFVHSQYLVSATNLDENINPQQRMRAKSKMYITTQGSTLTSEPFYRYIFDNSAFGVGGFVGLAQNLTSQSTYTVGLLHEIDYISNPDATEDEILTTSELVICGFQTTNQTGYLWEGTVSSVWETNANWANNEAPTLSTHNATIANVANHPVISGSTIRECGNLLIQDNALVEISDNSTIKIAGDIENNGNINLGQNASLLQTATGTDNNSGTGSYTILRDGTTSNYVFNIWSSPIHSAPLSTVFSSANPCDIWAFDRISQTWSYDYTPGYSTSCYGNPVTFAANQVISGGDGIMDIGGGYFIPGNISSTITFTGNVNNGDISVPISTTTLGNPGGSNWADDDWNLLGNPYPSALNASQFWDENAVRNARITTGLYFWDDADTSGGYNEYSDYATWNLTGGVNSGNSSNIPTGYISSGQGFWVYAAASTNIVFNNSMRADSNSQFFKNAPNENHNVWLSFTSPSNYQNNILVGYNQHTTDSIDSGYDGHKLIGNAHVKFASYINQEEFSIQSTAFLKLGETKIIPLVVLSDEYGIHTFMEYKRQNLPNNIQVILRDNLTGVDHNFSNGKFLVTLDQNIEYKERFELVLYHKIILNHDELKAKETLNGAIDSTATNILDNPNSKYSVKQSNNLITINNPNGINGQIQIIDVSGKIVWSNQQNGQEINLHIKSSQFGSGVYFLRIFNAKKTIFHTKVFIL